MMQRLRNIGSLAVVAIYLVWIVRLVLHWTFADLADWAAFLGVVFLSGILALFAIAGAQSAGTKARNPLR